MRIPGARGSADAMAAAASWQRTNPQAQTYLAASIPGISPLRKSPSSGVRLCLGHKMLLEQLHLIGGHGRANRQQSTLRDYGCLVAGSSDLLLCRKARGLRLSLARTSAGQDEALRSTEVQVTYHTYERDTKIYNANGC